MTLLSLSISSLNLFCFLLFCYLCWIREEKNEHRSAERKSSSSFHSTTVFQREEEEDETMWKLPWKHEGNPVRCCRVDPSDPSSAYRSLECLDGLQDQLDPQIDTLADVPRLCAERFPTKQTLGTRKILAIQQEKQTNGKVFKKVSSLPLLSPSPPSW